MLVLSAACDGEPAAPVEKRPPEYRNSAAEYLLARQARQDQQRRDEVDVVVAERAAHRAELLRQIPADFPRAFVDFPEASLKSGYEQGGVLMITQQVGLPAEEAWNRAKQQAVQSGWQLEIETRSDDDFEGSFLKGPQRVQLSVVERKRVGTHVIATLMDLDREKATPATE